MQPTTPGTQCCIRTIQGHGELVRRPDQRRRRVTYHLHPRTGFHQDGYGLQWSSCVRLERIPRQPSTTVATACTTFSPPAPRRSLAAKSCGTPARSRNGKSEKTLLVAENSGKYDETFRSQHRHETIFSLKPMYVHCRWRTVMNDKCNNGFGRWLVDYVQSVGLAE